MRLLSWRCFSDAGFHPRHRTMYDGWSRTSCVQICSRRNIAMIRALRSKATVSKTVIGGSGACQMAIDSSALRPCHPECEMEKELRLLVGVIAEERATRSTWADKIWLPVAVVEGGGTVVEGTLIRAVGMTLTFFVGQTEICCHRAESEAYLQNLPGLYVVLRYDDDGGRPLPCYVHTVTASPHEAQDYCDSTEDIVGRVSIPSGIGQALQAFVAAHPVEEPPRRRKRPNDAEHRSGAEASDGTRSTKARLYG